MKAVALVVSEYHAFITDGLETGARGALAEAGWTDDTVETFLVPGAFELPQAAQRIAESRRFAAVVCLGCLIRGETPHFDYIAQAASARHHARRAGDRRPRGIRPVDDEHGGGGRRALDPGPGQQGPRSGHGRGAAMVRLYARLAGDGSESEWDGS